MSLLFDIITVLVCCGVGLVLAVIRVITWRARRRLEYIDCISLFMFVFFAIGFLGNSIFIALFLIGGYALIENQGQSAEGDGLFDESEIMIDIMGMMFAHSYDIFLIDWERPSGEGKISTWRRILIAKEWVELQTFRKTRFTFLLFVVLLFLEVIGFKRFAQIETTPATSDFNENTPVVYNSFLRFAIASVVYGVAEIVQVLYQLLIHERCIRSRVDEFVDLCSFANISVLILRNRYFGYYIHGRSPHGRSDTDMIGLNEMLKREEVDLVPRRGLELYSDHQTFEIAVLPTFRTLYQAAYKAVKLLEDNPMARRSYNREGKNPLAASAEIRGTLGKFLSAFLDHAVVDLDYKIQKKTFLENIFDTELERPSGRCIFYSDINSNSFANCLFYGREFRLVMFDVVLFTILDVLLWNYLLSAIITYIVIKSIVLFCQALGRHNLSTKAFIPKRYL